MLKKFIISAVLIVGLGTPMALAKGNTAELAKLASTQEKLSKNIVSAYKKRDRGASVLVLINQLESQQMKLKSKVKNPEINYLLNFLHVCVKDLKAVVKKPYTSQNAQVVADLSMSLQEGSHYIRKSL